MRLSMEGEWPAAHQDSDIQVPRFLLCYCERSLYFSVKFLDLLFQRSHILKSTWQHSSASRLHLEDAREDTKLERYEIWLKSSRSERKKMQVEHLPSALHGRNQISHTIRGKEIIVRFILQAFTTIEFRTDIDDNRHSTVLSRWNLHYAFDLQLNAVQLQ